MARRFGDFVMLGFSLINVIRSSYASVVSTGDFNDDFSITWSQSHVNTSADGHSRSLKLDQESGAAFTSRNMFLFGQIDMQIKLISGYSAGTVLAYYLSSDQPNRDEIDFEFLGNETGQPYTLQTNLYVDGYDNREERISLWFDPTEEFHTYTILWNAQQIVFMVDWVPIRIYRNHEDKGAAFPSSRPMSLRISLWNGDSWATRGGLDKIDWSKGPFIAYFRNYKIDACVWKGNRRLCRVESNKNWWNKPNFSGLTPSQRGMFRWVRKYYLIYDYCNDPQRFRGHLPIECSLSKFY
ncbi:probable xyloglucan endotransglucosylase/hydrolase protein 10 [Dendrobium catenatum]|uniref:Xyloglucan endotransglucosylase/hydrolase n=1 Tax=Dendrobium catenatum TaxID=906689 RepID=A0A2I0WRX9_9ASPA|nr:probable xyloglucan endotransglucosylase/hydrolase protein 10 [Dendrobium catenatum]PKU78387.1 putative xyloglucan endotransglucosylase/hydrolase protein 10 [Dendrobium catenatum]